MSDTIHKDYVRELTNRDLEDQHLPVKLGQDIERLNHYLFGHTNGAMQKGLFNEIRHLWSKHEKRAESIFNSCVKRFQDNPAISSFLSDIDKLSIAFDYEHSKERLEKLKKTENLDPRVSSILDKLLDAKAVNAIFAHEVKDPNHHKYEDALKKSMNSGTQGLMNNSTIEHTKNYHVIKNLPNYIEQAYDGLLKKLDGIDIKANIKELSKMIKEAKHEIAEANLNNQINRYRRLRDKSGRED